MWMARKKQAKGNANVNRWPCVFYGGMSDHVDELIQQEWQAKYGVGAPFGSLRKEWRRAHCRTLNRYGSEDCPYPVNNCADAFYRAVHGSLDAAYDPRTYFISVARSSALERADNKPLARDRAETAEEGSVAARLVGQGDPARRDGVVPPDGSDGAVRSLGIEHGSHLRRKISRPTRIGTLLRSPDGGSREG
jgi:hypothetical protein